MAGPLRPALIRYYRRSARPAVIETNCASWVSPFSMEDALESLSRDGFASGMSITPACVDELLKCYDSKPIHNYLNPHLDHQFIRELASNNLLVAVARQYLGVEPVLLETRLHSYHPGLSDSPGFFHFDVGDVLSLTFFAFLSDVDDEDSVTHQVVAGTHRRKTLKELWTRQLEDDLAQTRYPGRVRTIMGKRGTAWFEDTCVFHKHGFVGKLRKAFSVQYAIHRSC